MPATPAVSDPSSLDRLLETLQEVSRARLSAHAAEPDVRSEPVPSEFPVLAHWLAMILLAGKGYYMVFKCYFAAQDARPLAARAHGKDPHEISRFQSHDFVGELCNLTAGGVSQFLNEQGVSSGISLPTILRGFDDLFFGAAPQKQIQSKERFWRLDAGGHRLLCSGYVEAYAGSDLDQVDFSKFQITDSDVEFL